MTEEQIQRQIDIINAAAKKALRSPEASRQFLIDAGIWVSVY
jgi:hypothetical protein